MQAAHACMHLCIPIIEMMLAIELNADNTLKFFLRSNPEDTASVIYDKNVKFGLVWPLWNSPF